ncbi:MAG: T9SS type A sorting domain-containing protein [Bacteroidia bacterium]
MKSKLIFFFFLFSTTVFAQLPYTQNNYAYDSLIDVEYGVAVSYNDELDTLEMDIFKPIGDGNCLRPIMIMVHGGAWFSGSKQEQNMVLISRELARKGWVVANINWRLGTHKTTNYNMYTFCNTSISAPCGYICDSSEVIRANYRGMQDAKGAIRYMKSRHLIDSTDINNVFITGESAGGFVALAVAFMDQANEKPIDCGAIANAPTPSVNLNPYACSNTPLSLQRPDLGSVDGTLHTGTYDAKVKGVASFYGGLFNFSLFQQQTDTPAVYLFHQGSDVVVNYNYGQGLGRLSWECFAQTNLCQSYSFYPYGHGGESIRQYFVSLGGNAPTYQADIVYNYSYMNNCLSNGHAIDNWIMRLQSAVNLFAPIIAASGNNPVVNCQTIGISESLASFAFRVYPNPSQEQTTIQFSGFVNNPVIRIYNAQGQLLQVEKSTGMVSQQRLNTQFSPGSYWIEVESDGQKQHQLFLIQ